MGETSSLSATGRRLLECEDADLLADSSSLCESAVRACKRARAEYAVRCFELQLQDKELDLKRKRMALQFEE
eukprot:3395479-Rhodomonas_salina.1